VSEAAAGGADREHHFPVRVYWEDTDASGIVYHASYLRFAERARSELLRLAGFEQATMLAETGVAFAVRHCEVDFRLPARLDDRLEIVSRIVEVRAATVRAQQDVWRAGALLARLAVKLACIDRSGRAVRVPAAVRAAFERFGNH
jgi:acyl-CoA thioester hydrolase